MKSDLNCFRQCFGEDPVRRNGRQQILLPQCQLCVDDVSVTSIICPNMKKNSKEPSFRPRTRILAVGGGKSDVLPEVVIEQEGTSSDEEQEAKRNESDTADEEFSNSASDETRTKVIPRRSHVANFSLPVHANRRADYFNELLGKQLPVPCSTWGMAEEIFRCTADEVRSRTCVGISMEVKVVWGEQI